MESSKSAVGLKPDEKPRRGRFLTTHNKKFHPVWRERTTLLAGWQDEWGRRRGRPSSCLLLHDLYWAWKLFKTSADYEAVVTGMERPSRLFALLQRVLRGKKVPHIMIEYLLNEPQNRLLRILKRLQHRLEAGGVSRIIVYSQRQPRRYFEAFGVPVEKLVHVPFQSTLYDTKVEITEGDYIFSGGDYTRDYATLVRAMEGLPYRVIIAALFRHYFQGIAVPPNFEIVSVSHEEFLSLMAGARIVVIPLRGGLLHSGGQQTYLNAMTMGKPVIVADDGGADEYITDGVNGLVVPPGNVAALKAAISTLMNDPELARLMGHKAKIAASDFRPECFFERVFAVIEDCVNCRKTQKDNPGTSQRRGRGVDSVPFR